MRTMIHHAMLNFCAEIPYCLKNENSSKQFSKKFDEFSDNKFDVKIEWLTKKVKTLFGVKDKSLHQACKIYKCISSCGECYIGETVGNVEIRWNEHNNPMNKLNHQNKLNNVDHVFN